MFVERPLFPPFKLRNLWCGCSKTNEMIGQSFPGLRQGADDGRRRQSKNSASSSRTNHRRSATPRGRIARETLPPRPASKRSPPEAHPEGAFRVLANTLSLHRARTATQAQAKRGSNPHSQPGRQHSLCAWLLNLGMGREEAAQAGG